jgi:hypothetical protein
MDAFIKFLGPFTATSVLTLVALAIIVVLRSGKEELDQRGMISQFASLSSWFIVASIPFFVAHYVFRMAGHAAEEDHVYALVGIIGGAILGFCLLGRSAFFSEKNSQDNK